MHPERLKPSYIDRDRISVAYRMTRTAVALGTTLAALVVGWTTIAVRAESGPHSGDVPTIDTTLVDTVAAGSVLIRMLPRTMVDEPVSEYRGLRVPARGWLYRRSFYWRVPSDARDRYTFLFAATHPSGVDTLRLEVLVTAPDS